MRDILLVYITKSGNTRLVAEAIASGARDMGLDAGVFSLCDVEAKEVLEADAVAFGSPTYEHRMLTPMENFLGLLDGKKCRGKPGIAFGSYGWSGEAPLLIAKKMRQIGFDVLDPVLRVQYEPLEKDAEACRLLGKGVAKKLKNMRRISL